MARIEITAAMHQASTEFTPELSPPHLWQVQPWARLVRALWRRRAYALGRVEMHIARRSRDRARRASARPGDPDAQQSEHHRHARRTRVRSGSTAQSTPFRRRGRFRHGVSILAIEGQVPIVPVYLSGLKSIRPKGARDYAPAGAGVEFLAQLTKPDGHATRAA